MIKFNAENERIKYDYFEYEKDAKGKAEATIHNMRKSILLFEQHTRFKSFKHLNKKDIVTFKRKLEQIKNASTEEAISKGYLVGVTRDLKNFFCWLANQPGYKSKINLTDIDYFSLSAKDTQIARSGASRRYPTLDQIEYVVKNMPCKTDTQKRNRAVIAFLILIGCRVSALASIRLKHIFLEDERIEQRPKEVKTKYSKKIVTYFFPVGDYLKNIVIEYVLFLKNEKLLDHNAPLFPSTKLSFTENDQFSRHELDVAAWQSTTSVRDIVKEAFEAAGLEYYNPHSFRNTIVQLGYDYCKTPEEFKAWSQNLGHNSPLTTFTSYGNIDESNQGRVIKGLRKQERALTPEELQKFRMLINNI